MTKEEEEHLRPAEERVFRLKVELDHLIGSSQDPKNDPLVRAKQAELESAKRVLARIKNPILENVNRRAIVTLYRGNRRPILTPRKLIDSTHLVVWTDGVTGDVDSGDDCADPSGSSGSRGADQTDCP